MNRRTLLAAVSAATAGVAGCIGVLDSDGHRNPDNRSDDGDLEYEWRHDIPGRGLTVAQGKVFGSEVFKSKDDPEADGGIFALDVETGNHQWTYGDSHPIYSGYKAPIVTDAVYTAKGDDTGTYGTIAIDFDGTGRWSAGGELITIADDIAYLLTDNSQALAVDTADGSTIWKTDFPEGAGGIVVDEPESDSHEMAYVTKSGYGIFHEDGGHSEFPTELFALDVNDGSVQWRYGNQEVQNVGELLFVSDGVVYLTDGEEPESIVAVAGGELLWSTDQFTEPDIFAASSEVVFIKDQSTIYALDAATGDKQWTQDAQNQRVHEDRVYAVTGKRVSAFEIDEGTELWTTEIGGLIQSIEVVGEGDDHSIFVHTSGTGLYRVNSDGDVIWTWDVEKSIEEFAAGQVVVATTDTHVYGVKPQ